MKRIDFWVKILNLTVTIIAAACCGFAKMNDQYLHTTFDAPPSLRDSYIRDNSEREFHYHISQSLLLLFKNAVLVYAICRFKSFIKSIQFAVLKRRLMVIHFSNVFVYTTLYIISGVLYFFLVKFIMEDASTVTI